ncbi:MAG TPA: hypothetical protein VMT03_10165 [Polyangia bacterium]|nr:hypothetical protein [Polyangia bacterium]
MLIQLSVAETQREEDEMNRVWVVITIVLLSSSAFAKSAKRAGHAKPPVTVIDMSGPSAPESEFPTVTKKGHL